MATTLPGSSASAAARASSDEHRHEHDAEYLAFDPTLASCCERDEHEYHKAMKLKSLLTKHDPSSSAVRQRQQLFEPPTTVEQPHTDVVQAASLALNTLDIEDSDSDFSDDDFGMDELMAARRAQLQEAVQHASEGYGIILSLSVDQLVQELTQKPSIPRICVIHSHELSDGQLKSLHDCIAATARTHLGTKFYTVATRLENSRDMDQLRDLKVHSRPSVAAFRDGRLIDTCSVPPTAFSEEASTFYEARVLPWLHMCNVLSKTRVEAGVPKAPKTPKADVEPEEPDFDCGIQGCRIRYEFEHEHVGPSQEAKDEISAWRRS